uniref:Uncharacterized protein n=1 Tax=Xiphophorus couchianus TaxID=32473 RepID=A0A3B5M4G0_9TELE
MAVDAASSFSFCRPAVEYRALPEDFKHQLSRRTGGNLTWHDGRGQKTAGGRTVKLLQQPGTEVLQVQRTDMMSARQTPIFLLGCRHLPHYCNYAAAAFYNPGIFFLISTLIAAAAESITSLFLTAGCDLNIFSCFVLFCFFRSE